MAASRKMASVAAALAAVSLLRALFFIRGGGGARSTAPAKFSLVRASAPATGLGDRKCSERGNGTRRPSTPEKREACAKRRGSPNKQLSHTHRCPSTFLHRLVISSFFPSYKEPWP